MALAAFLKTASSQKNPLKAVDKRIFLYDLDVVLQNLTSKEIQAATVEITELCLSLLQSEGGHSLTFQIANVYRKFRLDTQHLLSHLIQTIQKPQITELVRQQNIKMIGQVFSTVKTLVQPPAKDIIELIIKLMKQRPQEIKVVGYSAIAKVLKSGHAINHSELLLKTLLKLNGGDFLHEWIECITAIVDEYPTTYVQWYSVWSDLMQVSVKEMEIKCSHSLLSSLMRARLNEAKQQGNIKTSFKQFNSTLKGDGKKKQNSHVLDVPRTLTDIISFLASMVHKLQTADITQASQNICRQIFEFFSQIFKNSPEHLESVQIDHMLGCILSLIPESAQPYHHLLLRTLVDIIDTMESCDGYTEELFKLISQTLKTKKFQLSNETLLDLQTYNPKANKSVLVGRSVQICLLRTLNELLKKFDHDRLTSLQGSCNGFVDIILPYFQNKETSVFACEVIKTTGLRNPSWLHQLTSVLLSCVQIQHADILSQAPGYVYTGSKEHLSQHGCLTMQAQALSCLVKSFPQVIGGEPISIVNITLQVAKGLIEGKSAYNDISQFNFKSHNNRLQGFTILEGLIGLGSSWVRQHIDSLLALFSQTFSKQMCQVDFQRLSEDAMYLEFFVQEYKTKARALNCILMLLESVEQSHFKIIGSFLGNSTMYLLSKDAKLLWDAMSWQEVTLVHGKLFHCLSKVPPAYYKSKLVGLLHSLCDKIVNENVEAPKTLLEQEDESVGQATHSMKKFEVTHLQEQADLLTKDTSLLRQPLDLQIEKQVLVENAIRLFAQLYASGFINAVNQENLVKHFLAHTQPTNKNNHTEIQIQYRPEKLLKMQRIGATFLQLMKQGSEIVTQVSVKQLIQNLMLAQDENLARICGEIEIESNAQVLLQSGPDFMLDQIEETLAQNLHTNQAQSLAKTAVFCGLLIRNFDEKVWSPSISRITNIFLKLLQSQHPTVTKFAFHYSAGISRKSQSFALQVLPSLFNKYYSSETSQHQEAIRKSLRIKTKSLNGKFEQIFLQDIFDNNEGQIQLTESGIFDHLAVDLVFKDVRLVNQMLLAGKLDQLNGDGRLLYHVLNLMTDCQSQNSNKYLKLAQDSYLLVVQAQLSQQGIKTHLEFVKQCLSYVHLSPLTLYTEQSAKNEFARAIRSDTLAFILHTLVDCLSSLSLSTSELVQLLTFGLSVCSNPSKCIKLAGVKLLAQILQLLAYTVEQVGDVDEDLSPRTREKQIYVSSPLLLEQFEAQIFSIIRQVLTNKGADYQPEVVKVILDIVFDFVTFPITKDASLVKRIVEMITSDFKAPLFDGDIFTHEGLITELRYQKLSCLAQLYLVSQSGTSALKKGIKPSKFEESDRKSLVKVFSSQVVGVLIQQWQIAIQDIYNVQSNSGESQYKKNGFIVGGSFDFRFLQSQVSVMIEAILKASNSQEITQTVSEYILKCLSLEFDGDLFDFYSQKVTALMHLQLCIDRFAQEQLSELLLLLQDLTSLGISEVTQLVLSSYSQIVDRKLFTAETPSILQQVTAIQRQADPDLQEQSQMIFTQVQTNDLPVVRESLVSLESCVLGIIRDGQLNELNDFVSQQFNKVYVILASGTMKNQDIYLEAFPRILNQISHANIAYFLGDIAQDLNQIIQETGLASPESKLLFISMLVVAKCGRSKLQELVESISSQTFAQILFLITEKHQSASQDLMKAISQKVFELCYEDISNSEKCLTLLFKLYSMLVTSERTTFLVPYFALLLQVMQSKQQVNDLTRNQAAEHLALLVRVDLAAFQQFAISKDAQGQAMLQGVEKSVVENVIRNFSAAGQSTTQRVN